MSKSKGNIIEPAALLEKFGVDPIRYWASTSKSGNDTSYSEGVVLNGKKLVSKIKNAAKFCELHFKDIGQVDAEKSLHSGEVFCASDLWMLSKLNKVIFNATEHFNKFEYASARDEIETFFWQDFCDTYLELIKTRIYNDGNDYAKGQKSAIITLHYVLDTILRLFAPFVPYTTEEVYMDILKKDFSIHCKGNWPKEINFQFEVEQECETVIFAVLDEARKAKTQRQLSMKAPIQLIAISGLKTLLSQDLIKDLANVTCANKIEIADKSSKDLKVDIVF
jgi:valyl-tRNA synthetase